MRSYTCVLALLAVAACGPLPGVDATLTDHADALSNGGSDKLFDLVITDAKETYALSDLQLTYQPAGGTMTVLNFELTVDADGDGALGTGDTLTGVEPGPDLLNGS